MVLTIIMMTTTTMMTTKVFGVDNNNDYNVFSSVFHGCSMRLQLNKSKYM